jgi:hypothetical protein
MPRIEREDPTINAIKKANPAALVCYLSDGTQKTVAVTKAGNRWTKMADVLDTIPWERIECVDAKGGVLGVIENEDIDDIDDEESSSGGDARMAKIMLALMKATMTEARKMFEAQMQGNARLVESLGEGMHSLQQVHELAMRVQLAQATGAGGDDEVMQMMKLGLGMMMQPRIPPVGRPPGKPGQP